MRSPIIPPPPKVESDLAPAKIVAAAHHQSNANHEKQWVDSGIPRQLEPEDIPTLITAFKDALAKFNFDAMFEDIAHRNKLSISNMEAGKTLAYAGAMEYLAKICRMIFNAKSVGVNPPTEFWLDNIWVQADIAFVVNLHCRIRRYSGDPLKVILEYIPMATQIERC